MELIFVRHGDPDYSIDSLTERGWIEAQALVDRFKDMDIKAFYVSPLGRARDTASFTLKAMNREATVCDWLREFPSVVDITDNEELLRAYPDTRKADEKTYSNVAWDILPSYFATHPDYYHPERWKETGSAKNSDMLSLYDEITKSFDELLAKHGYVRDGHLFHAVNSNKDKIVFFCHYGITCFLLAYLLGISPFVLWQGISFAPTAVTTVVTEEREEGIAYFRANKIGDISHLYAKGIEPAFAARFCETFDSDERH